MRVRFYLLSIWCLMDPLYYAFTRLTYPETNRKDRVFRVRLATYKGPEVVLADGVKICKNDLVLKIHLHNVQLLKEMYRIENDFMKGSFLYHRIKNTMPALAAYINKHDQKEDIKGVIGITMLNRSSERLGFQAIDIMNRYYLALKYVTALPIYLLSSRHPIKKWRKKPVPKFLFMSKEKLLKTYAPK